MINKDSDIEIIISRYLSKESTAEDIKILDDWISATPENYKSFLAQKNIWEISHPAFNPEEIDVDSAHRKVMEQILHQNRPPVSVRPKLSFLHYWQQVAAILLLPLLILSAYLYFKPASQIAETYQELFTPYGTWSVVNLPDGSKVWLNAGSSLKYPTQFSDKQRVVSMQGEAYFEVESDKEHPFIVKTKQLTVEATGTAFNVNTYKWCSWKDGILIFRDDPLEYVFKRLGQTYNVEFILKDAELGKYSYKATFEGESLNEILRLLEMSAPIRCKEVSNRNTNNEKFEKQRIEVSRTMQ